MRKGSWAYKCAEWNKVYRMNREKWKRDNFGKHYSMPADVSDIYKILFPHIERVLDRWNKK